MQNPLARRFGLVFAFSWTWVGAAHATDRHVPADFPTIQAAIDASDTADRVLVAHGVYTEAFHFLGKAIEVASVEGPALTILDGAGAGPIVTFESTNGFAGTLRGFTLRNAVLTGPQEFGAAIHIENTIYGPRVEGNVFEQNLAYKGAAIGTVGEVIAIGNTFRNNTALTAGAVLWVETGTGYFAENRVEHNTGGVIHMYAFNATIRDNHFRDNRGASEGGVVFLGLGGGGIRDNVFEHNEAELAGGAVFLDGGASVAIVNNRFEGNVARRGGAVSQNGVANVSISANVFRANLARGAGEGGAVWSHKGTNPITIADNLFVDNRAVLGGALFLRAQPSGTIQVERNTLVENRAGIGSGLYAAGVTGVVGVSSNVLVAPEGSIAIHCLQQDPPIQASFDHNDVWVPNGVAYGGFCGDQTGSNGNLSVEPRFVDPAGGDYRLAPDSPCVDAGDPMHNPVLVYRLDLAGNVRVLDGNLDGEMVVDMGAHEHSHVTLTVEGEPVLGGELHLETLGTPALFGMVIVARSYGPGWFTPPFGTLYFQPARYGVVLAGETPLQGTWTIPTSWYPGTGWTVQAIVREAAPSAGNTSNACIFQVGVPE